MYIYIYTHTHVSIFLWSLELPFNDKHMQLCGVAPYFLDALTTLCLASPKRMSIRKIIFHDLVVSQNPGTRMVPKIAA